MSRIIGFDFACRRSIDLLTFLSLERPRVHVNERARMKAPETELGQGAKQQLDIPTRRSWMGSFPARRHSDSSPSNRAAMLAATP